MRKHKAVLAAMTAGTLVLVAAACSDDSNSSDTSAAETTEAPMTSDAAEGGTIVDVAVAAGSFDTLVSLVQQAGLAETLSGEGPFTVFAPTDEAFAAVDSATLEALAADPEALKQVLLHHVIVGQEVTSDMVAPGEVEMGDGTNAEITVDGDTVMIGDATVTAVDVQASNGVIHVIDSVLIPEGLDLSGATTDSAASADGTIVDVASSAGTFGTLLAAAQAAGLDTTLAGEGPFTVFAPTDEAFAALPAGLVDKLLLPENAEVLKDILLYHVIQGAAVKAADVQTGDVEMADGKTVAVVADGGTVTVNGVQVQTADVVASNGVIHVIGSVLVPPGVDVSAL